MHTHRLGLCLRCWECVPDMRQALALIPQQPIKPDKAAHTPIPTQEVEAEGLEVQSHLQLLGEF